MKKLDFCLVALIFGVVLGIASCTGKAGGGGGISEAHPRIWLDLGKLSELRAMACYDDSGGVISGCTPDSSWTTLKSEVDSHMSTNFYGNDGLDWGGNTDSDSDRRAMGAQYLANFAFAYQITQDPVYARAAILKTLQYWDTPTTGYTLDSWITFDWWYTARFLIPPGALIFDWCYDQMTSDERDRFVYQLDRWAYMILEDPQPSWSWHDGSGNYWYGYMWALTAVGYAIYEHNANALSYIDYVKTTMIPEAMNHINDEELTWPICNSWEGWCFEYGRSKGGEWSEGNSYGTNNTEFLAESLFTIKSAEGLSYFSQTDFFEEYILQRMHTQLPESGSIIVAGDGTSTTPDRAVERLAIKAILEKDPGSVVAGYGQKWLLDYSSLRSTKYFMDFIFYDDALVPLDYSGLDGSYFAEGMRIQSYKSSWADDALWLYMRFNSRHSGHTYDGEGGHFALWKNGWLIRKNDGAATTDVNHNIVYLPPDSDEPAHWGEPTVLKREVTEDYVYYAGDASDVFSTNCVWRSCNVTLNQRSFFYIKDNYLVIYDRVNTAGASDTKAWQVFFDDPLTGDDIDETNDIASYYNGTSKVFVKTLLPQNPVFTTASVDENGRLRVTYPASANYNNFLHAIEVKDGNVSMSSSSLIESKSGDTMVGAQIGNYIVMFSEDNTEVTSTSYDIPAGSYTHFVTGLKEGASFDVSAPGLIGIEFQASAEGVIKFTSSGSGTVTISEITL